MGIGSSVPAGPSADLVGKFRLTPEQEAQNRLLSGLFQTLLEKNNIMDLSKLVQSADACDDLIMVLSSQLAKEFQSLRFPDPENEARLLVTSFTDKNAYAALKTSRTRQIVCDEIAHFLFQFVVLVAALTSSISITEGGSLVGSRTTNTATAIPQLANAQSFKPVEPAVLDRLTASGFLTKRSEEVWALPEVDGVHYYLNIRGYIYSDANPTKVLGVQFAFKKLNEIRPVAAATPGVPGSTGFPSVGSTLPGSNFQKAVEAKAAEMARQKDIQQAEIRRQAEVLARQQQPTTRPYTTPFAQPIGLTGTPRGPTDGVKAALQQGLREKEAKLADLKRSLDDLRMRYSQQNLETTQKPTRMFLENQMEMLEREIRDLNTSLRGMPGGSANRPTTRRGRKGRRGAVSRRKRGGQVNFTLPTQLTTMADSVFGVGANANANTAAAITANTGASNTLLNPPEFVQVLLYDLLRCTPGAEQQCFLTEFYMNDEGVAWDASFLSGSFQAPAVSTGRPLQERIGDVMGRVSGTVSIYSRRVTTAANTNFSFSTTALERLQSLPAELRGGETIQAPAALRAYLLLSSIPSERPTAFRTRFCKDDPWTSISLQEIPAYALLEALYKERLDEKAPYSPDKSKFVGTLLERGFAVRMGGTNVAATTTPTFKQLTFPRVDTTNIFCAGSGDTEIKEQKDILFAAYGKLRGLYNDHLKNVMEFVQTLFIVDASTLQAFDAGTAPTLRLHPVFLESPTGSRKALEERVRAARQMLANHYYDVETVYRETIGRVGAVAAGTTVTTTIPKRG